MKGRLVACSCLSGQEKESMFGLFRGFFVDASAAIFEADLAEKDWVVLVESSSSIIRGFTTFSISATRFQKGPIRVLYSGDTVVHPDARGSGALIRTWLAAVDGLARKHPSVPLYWLLIVSGYRTYRYLPVFWKEYYPRFDKPLLSESRALRDALAQKRFGSRFDPQTGIARLLVPQVLRAGLADVPPGRQRDPHVAYFCRQNPGYQAGDELVCLTELNSSNLTPAGWRMLQAGLRDGLSGMGCR